MTFDNRYKSKIVEIFDFSGYQDPAGRHSGKLSNKNPFYVFNVIDWVFDRSIAACIRKGERFWLCRQNCFKSAFQEFLKIRFLSTEANWKKCLDDSSSSVLKFSMEIKMVEVKPAVIEKDEIEHQVVSNFTFSHGLWNFSDFDAEIKFFGLRNPSSIFGSILFLATFMNWNGLVVTEKHGE